MYTTMRRSLTDTGVSQSGQLVEVVFLSSVFKRSFDALVKYIWLGGGCKCTGRGNNSRPGVSLDGSATGEHSLHYGLVSFESELDFSF